MAKLSTDHRNLLHLVQIQPPSVRGIQLQRLLGVTLLHWLVPKFGQQQETGRRTDDERCVVAVPDTVEVRKVLPDRRFVGASNNNYYWAARPSSETQGRSVGQG